MTDTRTPEQRLSDEAARWRRRFRETRESLDEANRMLLALWLRGRLADPTDFDTYIGVDQVTDRLGRIRWQELARTVDQLLAGKPHLAAPIGNPFAAGSQALEWFLDES